jgi:L-lactate dehydrogenase (cytochrome)
LRVDRIRNVADARRLAARILPRVVFDYIDGGSDDEVTMRANEGAFDEIVFRPRMAVDVGSPSLATTVLGHSLSMPLMLAPCGLVRLMHPDAGAGVARAAAERGTLSVLSTVAGSSLREVAAAAPGSVWFQLYAAGGQSEAQAHLDQAKRAGIEVLVVTVDTPALGNRERDRGHGVSPPLRIDARSAAHLGPQVLTKPIWTWRMTRDGVSLLKRDRAAAAPKTGDTGKGFDMLSMVASPFLWSDIDWMRGQWDGKLVVKGLLTGDDARRAVDVGSDAVIISNHGGRQLDGAPATLRVLPEIVEAVGSRTEVLFDGGIRRGTHVVKALALGARGVFIGRPYLYGLAAAGQAGVEHVLGLLRTEMVRTMVLLGCPSVDELGPDWVE